MHEMVVDSLQKVDTDLRKDLQNNIVLCGGNTYTTGFADRMHKELTSLLNGTVRIIAAPERKYSAWIGGSIEGSLSAIKYLTKEEYDEHGPTFSNTKFF